MLKIKKILLSFGLLFSFVGAVALSSCDLLSLDTSSNDGTKETTSETSNNTETYKLNKASYYSSKEYKGIVSELTNAGFTNITVIRSGNLITGWMSTENTIKEMTVDGDKSFKAGDYSKDVAIIIYVHSFDNKCPDGHDLVKVTKKNATCQEYGISMDSYYCATCDKYYTDSKGNGLLNKSDIILDKKHDVVLVQKIDSTCSETGVSEHYECNLCHKWFSDANAINEVTSADCIISKKTHQIISVSKVDSTCSEFGVDEHYECEHCHECFADSNGTTIVSSNDLRIAKKDHTPVTDDAVEATYNKEGKTQGSHCGVCGAVIVAQTTVPRLYPIMTGASFTDIKARANQLGLYYKFELDYSNGVYQYTMETSNGGISLDILYKKGTNYVLGCSISCFNTLATTADQITVIKGIASYICPSSDSSSVVTWVNSNIGSTITSKIGKFTYELYKQETTNGYTNYGYAAGVTEWEKWDQGKYEE